MASSQAPEVATSCPYCGEGFATLVDTGGEDSSYIEDCPVCCAPIQFTVSWPEDGGPPEVTASRDDD